MADLRDEVRARYAQAARVAVEQSSCCEPAGATDCCDSEEDRFGSKLYGASADELPEGAVVASLGCGNPTAIAQLRSGEVVLDLGSGGGIDVLLSARRVGPTGRAYGLDMTDEMIALARRHQEQAGVENAEFLKGHIEEIPLRDETVDVVLSNCVINLSVDKPAVFSQMYRVLRPGGRVAISDVVAEDHLTPADRAKRGSYVGCIAGALSFVEYAAGLEAAGFVEVSIVRTHAAADEMYAATIRARKPNPT